jgi:hypothetical protein
MVIVSFKNIAVGGDVAVLIRAALGRYLLTCVSFFSLLRCCLLRNSVAVRSGLYLDEDKIIYFVI